MNLRKLAWKNLHRRNARAFFTLADEPTGNLDTATGEQILGLFSALHRSGKTVIMATHNRGILSRATRSVGLRDGEVVEDARVPPQAAG